MSRAQTRVWSAAAGLLVANWAWQTHPVWTVAGAVLVIGAGAAMLWRRRAQLRAPGERTWLYRHYDRAGSPVYYGITNDYPDRCAEHAAGSWWWYLVDPARSTVQEFPNRPAALLAETRAIRSDCPPGNVQHNWRRGRRPVYGRAA